MEELWARLTESADVIVVMGVVLGALFRMYLSEKKAGKEATKAYLLATTTLYENNAKAIEKLNQSHSLDIKEMYNEAKEIDKKLLLSIDNLTDAIDDILK